MDHMYSYLHDVWETPTEEAPGTMEDIMSAYHGQKSYGPRPIAETKPFEVEGYNGPTKQTLYDFDKMFENDTVVLTQQQESKIEPSKICMAEEPVIPTKTVIENVVEPFAQQRDQYSDLIIFLLSGILLIFLFDKLVQLGRQLK